MANINITIPDDLHKKAKKIALDRDITLKQFIIGSIRRMVENG